MTPGKRRMAETLAFARRRLSKGKGVSETLRAVYRAGYLCGFRCAMREAERICGGKTK